MAINDPSYFLTNYKGDFNDKSTDNSGYGILPAVEQNQTYFAYFNSISATSPELLGQTAFFIKYLIDKDGNITKPKSNNISLINLYSNFEQGKIATVLPQVATQTVADLIGDHTITDIGTIQPLLITETGSVPSAFVPTMSFVQYDSISQINAPEFNFLVKKSSNTFNFSGNNTPMTYDTEVSDPSNSYNSSTHVYTVPFNTSDYGIQLSFQAAIAIAPPANSSYYFFISIQKSTDGGTNWSNLYIQEYLPPNPPPNRVNVGNLFYDNDGVRYRVGVVNVGAWGDNAGGEPNQTGATFYNYIKSLPSNFNQNDQIRVLIGKSIIQGGNPIVYGGGATTETFFTVNSNYTPTLQVTSSYWDGATYPLNDNNFSSSQYLTASLKLSSFINTDYVQITPTASLSMSFSNIILPANIQPGDYIRFEYDPSKQSRIYEVGNLDDGRTTLRIYPPIPTGSKLDHFVVYRIVKDGNYVILNKPKKSGANLTGFLQPKYITQELKDNFTNIISKLEADGLLND